MSGTKAGGVRRQRLSALEGRINNTTTLAGKAAFQQSHLQHTQSGLSIPGKCVKVTDPLESLLKRTGRHDGHQHRTQKS
jgi:hypothetical protein